MQFNINLKNSELYYDEKVNDILSTHINNKKINNLTNVKKILNYYNNPQDYLKIIHIAGTNGKGSTSSMISSILCEEGYTVGLFTSPHLVFLNERIKISNEKIPYKIFYELLKKIDNDSKSLNVFLGFFDILTVTALLFFYQRKCDYVVLETGLGGEYDATNVSENVLISVITNIGIDHEKILGDTVNEIAVAKSGIIKKNCPVVLYDLKEERDVFVNKAKELGSDIFFADFSKITIYEDNSFDYKTYKKLKTNMSGIFQIYNAATAIEAIDVIKKNCKVSDNSIRKGLLNVKLDGRFQIISKKPYFIIDGGHNVQCIETVIKDINIFVKKNKIKKMILILSILDDKNIEEMVDKIFMSIECDNIKTIITKVKSKRAFSIEYIYDCVKKYNKDITIIDSVEKVVDFCKQNKDEESLMYATGSLYLIGEILKYLG